MSDRERSLVASQEAIAGPNFKWLLIYMGLAWFLSQRLGSQMPALRVDRVGAATPGLLGLFVPFQRIGWGNIYFTIVILFGVAYYFLYRGTEGDKPPPRWWLIEMAANVELGALGLAAALIAPLFWPALVSQVVGFVGLLTRSPQTTGAIYLGLVMALGIAWYVLRRPTFDEEKRRTTPPGGDPNLERLGLYLGLLLGLGLSIRNGLKGWFNIYKGNEAYWSRALWQYLGPVYLVCLIAIVGWILFRPLPRSFRGRLFPHAYGLMWLVLIVQNVLAQLITGPPTRWNEMAFSIYYLLLFLLTGVIIFHFHGMKEHQTT
jgi:hypothetical protein